MFDIGFFELMIIGIIGLVVLGPERLPHAIRMSSAWLGKIRRASIAVKEGLENEINAHEIKKRIQEQVSQTGLEDLAKELQADLDKAKTAIDTDIAAAEQSINPDDASTQQAPSTEHENQASIEPPNEPSNTTRSHD